MTLPFPFGSTQTNAEQPIDQDLAQNRYQYNIEDLDSRTTALEAAAGGGGAGAQDTGAIGTIVMGGSDNCARYWKRRFHPFQHMLNSNSDNPSGFDPEGMATTNELLQYIQTNDSGLTHVVSTNSYLGELLRIAKSSALAFKIKKGINFFSLSFNPYLSGSDNIVVKIDGITPSSLGLVDENGNAALDTFSTNTATTYFQKTFFYYGLDGEEHIVEITNNDSASKAADFNFVEVGYRSENPTIDEKVKINSGKALVRGSQVNFSETELTFGTLDKNGHTGSIVCDSAGTLSALDGESPAMTQVKPEETIAFSGAVTQLPVKNNFYFPASGICLLSTPHGAHHLFSYTDKTDTTIQAHTLNNILWQSRPTQDFIPCNNFNSATVGTATGDLNINYWGTAPILIDSTNNKIDFKITIAGVTTTHVATIANGRYSADLIPLEAAVRSAMQTAKAINGEYHLEYNAYTHLWEWYVDSIEVEAFQLLFSTGVSVANSVHSTLGFASTDLVGSLSYLATTQKEHLCCRALEADLVYMNCEDPRIKYSTANTSTSTAKDGWIKENLNLGTIRTLSGNQLIQIFPDSDCSGLQLDFFADDNQSMISVQIDDMQSIYLCQADSVGFLDSAIRGRILSSFISFPRGSRKISIRNESSTQFQLTSTTDYLSFIGCRQYFSKPCYEKLKTTESIIKTYDISPISLYATEYGHNGGVLYSPTGTDNINTITESGSWIGVTAADRFNNARRYSATTGDYVEIDFTLQGNGGGIYIKRSTWSGASDKTSLYLSQSAINEATDLIRNNHDTWTNNYFDQCPVGILGLKAGTYKARYKHTGTSTTNIENSGIVIIDTVPPEENKNTVSDITGAGQSIAYPINVNRVLLQRDSGERVPSWLERSGYKEGKSSKSNYSLSSAVWINNDDSATVLSNAESYYSNWFYENPNVGEFSFSAFMKSCSLLSGCFNTNNITMTTFIDGISVLNTFSQRVQVKGGSAPSATRLSFSRLNEKKFDLTCSHSTGLVFNIADTRGIQNNRTVILYDGTNYEKAVISSFVVGVSFTIKKALTTVIAANVIRVFFQGFHNILLDIGATGAAYISCFEYEPLTVTPSKALIRRNTVFKYEKVSITHRFVTNSADMFYPVHSDGVAGNWATSTIEFIGTSIANAWYLRQDLKNIYVSSGSVDLKISSHRLVPLFDEKEKF